MIVEKDQEMGVSPSHNFIKQPYILQSVRLENKNLKRFPVQ